MIFFSLKLTFDSFVSVYHMRCYRKKSVEIEKKAQISIKAESVFSNRFAVFIWWKKLSISNFPDVIQNHSNDLGDMNNFQIKIIRNRIIIIAYYGNWMEFTQICSVKSIFFATNSDETLLPRIESQTKSLCMIINCA